MKFLNQVLSHSKTIETRSQKEWIVLLDELTALTVKARDGFRCRASDCSKQWLPVMLAGGRVIVAEDCHWAHIVPRVRGLALRHEMDNGITLCFKHHKQFDAFYENEKFEFLKCCGMDAEIYLGLQARAHEVKTDFDGATPARARIKRLKYELQRCEDGGVALEIDCGKVCDFFRERIC